MMLFTMGQKYGYYYRFKMLHYTSNNDAYSLDKCLRFESFTIKIAINSSKYALNGHN